MAEDPHPFAFPHAGAGDVGEADAEGEEKSDTERGPEELCDTGKAEALAKDEPDEHRHQELQSMIETQARHERPQAREHGDERPR